MDEASLRGVLKGLPIPALRCYESIGSTNDAAREWLEAGAPDGALVIADAQTNGRGRFKRRWFTQPGTSLAFSLIIRPEPEITRQSAERMALFSPLGAISVCQALVKMGLEAQIKWSNDVLLGGRKVAGILAEADWVGETLQGIVLGIGVNVAPTSVPADKDVIFPATSVEQVLGKVVDRFKLLAMVLPILLDWRSFLFSSEFIKSWETRLAFRGEWVYIYEADERVPITGKLMGLNSNGSLRIQTLSGATGASTNHNPVELSITAGDIRLRPV